MFMVHEWSPSLLSPSFVEQVARSSLSSNIVVHVQVKFADLKFTVIARIKQTYLHTHTLHQPRTAQ